VFSVCRKCVTEKRSLDPTVRKENIFARPLHNEQFYSLSLGSKVALFLPWKKNNQLKLYALGKKSIATQSFMILT
jgi:hypothetical protein